MICSELQKQDIDIVKQELFDFKSTTEEEVINDFLDKILDLQSHIKGIYSSIDRLVIRLEKISWHEKTEENLGTISDIISLSKQSHSNLIRFYVKINNSTSRSIAKEYLRKLKNSIDDLKETINDLEFTFFYAPNSETIKEITEKLSLM